MNMNVRFFSLHAINEEQKVFCVITFREYTIHRSNCFQWFNPFPNKLWFLCVYGTRLLKTLWEKEKLLIMSNFSFTYSIFYPIGELSAIFIKFEIVNSKLFQFGRGQNLSFGKGLKVRSYHFPKQSRVFMILKN